MFQSEKVMVVEDELDICELLQFHLEKNGYKVSAFANGTDAVAKFEAEAPQLMLLDLMLPGLDGLQVLKAVKSKLPQLPVILVTAKGEESDIVIGLELGADDYIIKPFSMKELLARVKTSIRRTKPVPFSEQTEKLSCGPIELDMSRHEVQVRGKQVSLTLAEFRLLSTLVQKPGRVFTRDQLLEKITGGEAFVIDRNVDVHIRALRKKFEEDADFIITVRGIGYKCREM